MTRREFLGTAAAASASPAPILIPLHRVADTHSQSSTDDYRRFWWKIWPEAVREFGRCGVRFQITDTQGEVKRTAADRPVFVGLRRGALNLVLTDHIPMLWDKGRAIAGVTLIYEGYHICLIALRYAHGNVVPFLSLNTCFHEMLHALLLDVYVKNPKWLKTNESESRDDWYATTLWLFHNGDAIRRSAAVYAKRLQAGY